MTVNVSKSQFNIREKLKDLERPSTDKLVQTNDDGKVYIDKLGGSAIALPQGTTAERPSDSAPYIRKNTTNNALEFYNGTEWVEIITDYFPTGSTTLG